MIHYLRNLSYYVWLSVPEVGWSDTEEQMGTKEQLL